MKKNNKKNILRAALTTAAVLIGVAVLVSCSGNPLSEGDCLWDCFSLDDINGGIAEFSSVCADCRKVRVYKTAAAEGLQYSENSDGTLTVTGIGSNDSEFLYISAKSDDGKAVTAIGEAAFDGNERIKYVVIGSGIKNIGDYAFVACHSLLSVTLPETLESLGAYCFYECDALYGASVPDVLSSIPDYCFSGCTALRSFSPGSKVETIGKGSFARCRSLDEISLPGAVTIGEFSFENCDKLSGVEIPLLSGEIPSYAFSLCKALKEFTVPENVTSLGSDAFYSCDSLERLYLGDNVTTLTVRSGESPFFLCNEKKLTVYTTYEEPQAGWDEGYDICNYLANEEEGDGEPVRCEFVFGSSY